MRASLKGRHSTKDGRTRHRVHSKPKTHKGAAVKDSGSNTDSLDLSNYCPSDLILKRIYLRRTATALTACHCFDQLIRAMMRARASGCTVACLAQGP